MWTGHLRLACFPATEIFCFSVFHFVRIIEIPHPKNNSWAVQICLMILLNISTKCIINNIIYR